ncbi:MAG: type I restriction-modification system subunit M [Lachnospiraceae bacterium]|nr:type I restriction-modification system subunit M [Lachnospiraceae bacterium]
MNKEESKKELISVLWNGADVLRSKMDANEYKDYLLSFVFYKYLSDSFLVKVYDLLNDCEPESIEAAQEAYEAAYLDDSIEDLLKDLKETCHYVIEPSLTFFHLAKKARNNEFQREELQRAFNNIEESDPLFANLFDDVDLYSNRLGTGDMKQGSTVSELMKEIDKADLLHTNGDVLGAAYEYLIGQFASETGKKAGEFYTPAGPAEILTRIAISGQEDKKGLLIYDPCMGSGSLLLDAKKFSSEPLYIRYYGQELMTSTYNLARMNMFLHNIAPENQYLNNGDTLDADWPTDQETEFDMVVMNPPYSAKWSAAQGFLSDERFSDYGVLAPKSKADYAFLLHGFYHLKSSGTMAIVLPHGVLFRGASEGTIRQKLLENGSIYAVIGLPANMFYNTSIPTCIIILKKHREGRDVLFIDASKQFVKDKKQNVMTEEHINHVIELYAGRKTVEKETYLATYSDIEKNDFNLNIPRYVDSSEEEEEIKLSDLIAEMNATNTEIDSVQAEINALLKDLCVVDAEDTELKGSLAEFIKMMEDM